MSLLHVAARRSCSDLCLLLLDLGSDPDQTDHHGSKALHYVSVRCNDAQYDPEWRKDITSTMKILTRSQKDLTMFDLWMFAKFYFGDPESGELMLTQEISSCEGFPEGAKRALTLWAVLKIYGAGDSTWTLLLRKLLRAGVDGHASVWQEGSNEPHQT